MFRYEELKKRPSSFRNLTGISVSEFDELYQRFEPLWQQSEQKRLSRSQRVRAMGGGRKYELDLRSQVVLTLVWLNLYLTTETLGILFEINKATVSRNTRRVIGVLRRLGEDTLWWHEPPGKYEGRTLAQAVVEHPDLLAVLDVMEVTVQRPQQALEEKAHFSLKKKAHTRKVGLIVSERGHIRGVTQSQSGHVHDLTLVRQSGLLQYIPPQTAVIGDKAFRGLQYDLPDHSIAVPFKPGKNTPLDDAQKWANRDLSRQRIIVENTICELRHFKSLSTRFRHAVQWVSEVVYALIALINPRITRRLAVAG